jgi:hypothetical protein
MERKCNGITSKGAKCCNPIALNRWNTGVRYCVHHSNQDNGQVNESPAQVRNRSSHESTQVRDRSPPRSQINRSPPRSQINRSPPRSQINRSPPRSSTQIRDRSPPRSSTQIRDRSPPRSSTQIRDRSSHELTQIRNRTFNEPPQIRDRSPPRSQINRSPPRSQINRTFNEPTQIRDRSPPRSQINRSPPRQLSPPTFSKTIQPIELSKMDPETIREMKFDIEMYLLDQKRSKNQSKIYIDMIDSLPIVYQKQFEKYKVELLSDMLNNLSVKTYENFKQIKKELYEKYTLLKKKYDIEGIILVLQTFLKQKMNEIDEIRRNKAIIFGADTSEFDSFYSNVMKIMNYKGGDGGTIERFLSSFSHKTLSSPIKY